LIRGGLSYVANGAVGLARGFRARVLRFNLISTTLESNLNHARMNVERVCDWESLVHSYCSAKNEVEAPMILIAMTCVATLFLLIFGALWHQTLMLARRDRSANLN